ncbi:hypothetical protein U1769_24405 [Sphingomonas sp. ZT3P38]
MAMRAILKDGFFWRFAGGFVIGAISLLVLQPAEATVPAERPALAAQMLP